MENLTKCLILALTLVGFTYNVKAQSADSTTVYESYTFHKDSVLLFDYGRTNTYWAIAPYSAFDPNNKKDTLQEGHILNLVKKFNKEVTIDSISMYFIKYTNNISFNFRVFNINDGAWYSLPSNIYNLQQSYSFTEFRTDSLKLSYLAANEISTRLYLLNPTIFYHYTKSNTSINELSLVNDVKFVNHKFESTSKIDNIKVYDYSGKLIQEGTINDIYQLEKNTLYFALFDNKYSLGRDHRRWYSKKIFTTN